MLQICDKLRVCNICGCTNTSVLFYSGVTSRCAECHKKCVRTNRAKKVNYYRAYDAKRFKEQPQRKAQNEKYNNSPKGKELRKSYVKKWQTVNQVKRRAHIKLNNAVRDGLLEKPTNCQMCGGSERRLHGHHHDYASPLDVVWVCPPCHREFHK